MNRYVHSIIALIWHTVVVAGVLRTSLIPNSFIRNVWQFSRQQWQLIVFRSIIGRTAVVKSFVHYARWSSAYIMQVKNATRWECRPHWVQRSECGCELGARHRKISISHRVSTQRVSSECSIKMITKYAHLLTIGRMWMEFVWVQRRNSSPVVVLRMLYNVHAHV